MAKGSVFLCHLAAPALATTGLSMDLLLCSMSKSIVARAADWPNVVTRISATTSSWNDAVHLNRLVGEDDLSALCTPDVAGTKFRIKRLEEPQFPSSSVIRRSPIVAVAGSSHSRHDPSYGGRCTSLHVGHWKHTTWRGSQSFSRMMYGFASLMRMPHSAQGSVQ